MTSEPRWLTTAEVMAIHGEQLARFGGLPGLRDEGALESAVARPRNRWAYGERELGRLAAAYAFGLVRNHAFADGNKRIGFAATMVFLRLYGVPFRPDPAEATLIFLDLAAGLVDEAGVARWIHDRWPDGP